MRRGVNCDMYLLSILLISSDILKINGLILYYYSIMSTFKQSNTKYLRFMCRTLEFSHLNHPFAIIIASWAYKLKGVWTKYNLSQNLCVIIADLVKLHAHGACYSLQFKFSSFTILTFIEGVPQPLLSCPPLKTKSEPLESQTCEKNLNFSSTEWLEMFCDTHDNSLQIMTFVKETWHTGSDTGQTMQSLANIS